MIVPAEDLTFNDIGKYVEPGRDHNPDRVRHQPSDPVPDHVLHVRGLEPRPCLDSEDGQAGVDGSSQEVHQPDPFSRVEERLQERLGPRPIPTHHPYDLTHLPITEPAETLAEMPSPLGQYLVPAQTPQNTVRREVHLAPFDRIQDLIRAVPLKPGRLEILVEGPVEDGLEVEEQTFRALRGRDLHVVGSEESRDPLVDLAACLPDLDGEGAAQVADGGSGVGDAVEEGFDGLIPRIEEILPVDRERRRAADLEPRFQLVAIDLELVQLLLELRHGVLQPRSFQKRLVAFPGRLQELLRQLGDCELPLLFPRRVGRFGAFPREGREERFEDAVAVRRGAGAGIRSLRAVGVERDDRDLLAGSRPALVPRHSSIATVGSSGFLIGRSEWSQMVFGWRVAVRSR